jgi:hypothetical protein
MSDLFLNNSNTNTNPSNSSTLLKFYNDKKNLSYNQIKNKFISNLNKAYKILDKETFNKLKEDLILNMKYNDNFTVSIDESGNYTSIDELSGGSLEQSTEETPSKEPSTEQQSTEQEHTEETTSKEPLTEEKLTEQEHTEETPSKEPSTEQQSTEQEHTEETPSKEPSTEQQSTEQEHTEETTSKEPLTEEKLTGQQSNNKSFFSKWLGLGGNISDNQSDYNSDYQSDNDYNSDNEQTYMIQSDESDEESFMDKAKLNNKKYLSTLKVKDLRDIMRNNNMKLSKNGLYLNKNQMIKNISKNINK